MSVVHDDGQAHGELSFGIAHEFVFILRHAELFRRLVQDMQHIFIRIVISHFVHLVVHRYRQNKIPTCLPGYLNLIYHSFSHV